MGSSNLGSGDRNHEPQKGLGTPLPYTLLPTLLFQRQLCG